MGNDLKYTVMAANERSQYDTAAKVLLAHKNILSRILVATVNEFKDMHPDKIEECIEGKIYISDVPVDPGATNVEKNVNGERIIGLNTVHPEIEEGYVTFDVIFYVRMRDGLSQIIINVEAQKNDPSGYDILNRAIFYVSRLISSQKERDFTGNRYNDLKRVYSIWICMNMDECIWNHIHLTNDAIMSNHEWKGKLDLLNIVLLGIPNDLPQQAEKYELHRLLSTIFSLKLNVNERLDILENEYDLTIQPEFRKELDLMCNLSQGIYEQGIEQGIEQGRVQGEIKKAQTTAVKLHHKGWKDEEIADLLNYGVEVIRDWLGLSLA